MPKASPEASPVCRHIQQRRVTTGQATADSTTAEECASVPQLKIRPDLAANPGSPAAANQGRRISPTIAPTLLLLPLVLASAAPAFGTAVWVGWAVMIVEGEAGVDGDGDGDGDGEEAAGEVPMGRPCRCKHKYGGGDQFVQRSVRTFCAGSAGRTASQYGHTPRCCHNSPTNVLLLHNMRSPCALPTHLGIDCGGNDLVHLPTQQAHHHVEAAKLLGTLQVAERLGGVACVDGYHSQQLGICQQGALCKQAALPRSTDAHVCGAGDGDAGGRYADQSTHASSELRQVCLKGACIKSYGTRDNRWAKVRSR